MRSSKLLMVAVLVGLLGACAKSSPVPGGVSVPKTPQKAQGTFSRHEVTLSNKFLTELDQQGMYGSLLITDVCINAVVDGSQVSLELVNQKNCDSGSAPDEANVFKRLNTIASNTAGELKIYFDKPTNVMGILQVSGSGNAKKYTLADLCTGDYYYENDLGTCILTVSEETGQFEDLYVWDLFVW